MRLTNSLSWGLKGTMARLPDSNRAVAFSKEVSWRPASTLFSSGPWHLKQRSAKMGLIWLLKSSLGSAGILAVLVAFTFVAAENRWLRSDSAFFNTSDVLFWLGQNVFSPRRHDDTTFCSALHDANVVSSCRRGEKNKQRSCAKTLRIEPTDSVLWCVVCFLTFDCGSVSAKGLAARNNNKMTKPDTILRWFMLKRYR